MADWGEGFQLTKWARTKIERRKADKVTHTVLKWAESQNITKIKLYVK